MVWHLDGVSLPCRTVATSSTTSAAKPLNRSLHAAKTTKQDEFYTQLSDIEKELRHYAPHFAGKTVLCNCDDPRVSNFFHYFTHHFDRLGLKKLVTTCYQNNDANLFSEHDDAYGLHLEYTGSPTGNPVPDPDDVGIKTLEGDGDFRSPECVELMKQADIVVTNPPFSLFREYVGQLMEHDKKFLIIGNGNAFKYKGVFNFIKDDRIWLGYTHPVAFRVPDHYEMRKVRSWRDDDGNNWRSLGNAYWFTNLDIPKRHEKLVTYKTYDPNAYPKYVNYDAVEVGRTDNIPADYDGVMGVPITFLDKHNPDQFEILGTNRTIGVTPIGDLAPKGTYSPGGACFYLDNGDGTYRRLYDRFLIKRKK